MSERIRVFSSVVSPIARTLLRLAGLMFDVCLLVPVVLPAGASGQEAVVPEFSGSLQTGLAETFQLTLGGTFAEAPVWQNRITLNWHGVFRSGDRIVFTGWNSSGVRNPSRDWLAGFSYRPSPLTARRARSTFSYGLGVQRWRFPSVRADAQDWLVAADIGWQSTFRFQPWATSEFWYNAHSSLPVGQLLYSQTGVQHQLLRHENLRVGYRHGVAYTYAWGFYGKQGWRVIRYVGTLTAAWKNDSVEFGLRPQHGLQAGIPDNWFWTLNYTRRF